MKRSTTGSTLLAVIFIMVIVATLAGIVLTGLWTFVRLCPPPVVREHVVAIAEEKRPRG